MTREQILLRTTLIDTVVGQTLKLKILTFYMYYSQASRKRPPKMQRLCGRLREVVAYKNRTKGSLFREEVRHIYFMEDNLLHTMSKSGSV